jgi:hypothetical protein
MAEQRVVGRDDEVGVAGLVEMPAIAIAFGLDDADLAELLQRPVTRTGLGVEVCDRRQIAVGAAGRVFHVVVVDREFVQQWHAGVLQHGTLFGEVAAAAEILSLAADHDHLHVVVNVAFVDEVGVDLAHPQCGRVLRVRTVEGDRRDPILLVLLELDVLLGFLLHLFVVEFGHAFSSIGSCIRLT